MMERGSGIGRRGFWLFGVVAVVLGTLFAGQAKAGERQLLAMTPVYSWHFDVLAIDATVTGAVPSEGAVRPHDLALITADVLRDLLGENYPLVEMSEGALLVEDPETRYAVLSVALSYAGIPTDIEINGEAGVEALGGRPASLAIVVSSWDPRGRVYTNRDYEIFPRGILLTDDDSEAGDVLEETIKDILDPPWRELYFAEPITSLLERLRRKRI